MSPHPANPRTPRYRRLAYGLPAVVSFGLYLVTMAPTVTSADSGELIAAAHGFGIPHPPGFPLWTILCGLFVEVVPVGSIAWRANLFSALCSSLATLPLFAAIVSCGLRRSVALSASLIWACSGTLWSQSVITEVYGLNALLCASMIWAFIKWFQTRQDRYLIWASLFFGLGMANHHTIAFVALALGLWAAASELSLLRKPKLIGACLSVFVAGLLPYIYLPLRAQADPPMNWGDPSSPERFVAHVARAQYGLTAPLEVHHPRSLRRFAAQCAYVGGVVGRDLTPPLAVLGGAALAVMLYRRNPFALMVLLILLSSGALFLLISNIDLDRSVRFAMQVFFIPLSLALVIPIAFALNWLVAMVATVQPRMASKLIAAAIPLSAALLPALMNYRRCNYAEYWYAQDHAQNMLVSMVPNAIILPGGDHAAFPLMYMTMVEGVRPDVTIADKYGYVDPAVLRSLAADTNRRADLTTEADRRAWIMNAPNRPVYVNVKTRSPVQGASFVPVGVVYRLLPRHASVDHGVWDNIHYRNVDRPASRLDLGACHILADYYFFRGLNSLRLGLTDQALASFKTSTTYTHGIKESFNNVGSALAEHGLTVEATEYLEHARSLDKSYLTPRRNLVRIYEHSRQWTRLEQLLRELIAAEPQDYRAYSQLGTVLANVQKDSVGAREWWERSLELNPQQPRVREALAKLDEASR